MTSFELRWKKKQQNVTQSMVDACILEEISIFLTSVLSQSERKTEAAAPASAGKRSRHSNEFDDPAHLALTGHDYSQRFTRPPDYWIDDEHSESLFWLAYFLPLESKHSIDTTETNQIHELAL